jgi:hypothetical protein
MTGLEFLMAARAFAGERAAAPIATLTLGRRIVNREAIDGERPFAAGEQVYAHTTIAGQGAGFIEHVWTHEPPGAPGSAPPARRGRANGSTPASGRTAVEIARHYMPVGDDRCWRTWSRHRVEPGRTTVEVFAPDGRRLAAASFTVA